MSDGPDANDQLIAGTLPEDPRQSPRLRLVAGPREPGSDDVDEEEAPESSPEVHHRHAFTMKQLLEGLWLEAQAQEEVPSVSMCHSQLNKLIQGFRPRHIVTLGAVTSWGKSTWAIMVVDEAIREGQRALIVTTEDDEKMYGRRFAARRANLNSDRLKANQLNKDELQNLSFQVAQAEDVPAVLNATGKPIEWIAKAIKGISSEHPLDLVVLDYLQRTKAAKQLDTNDRVAYVADLFADTVKGAGAAGLMLSQIKRLDNPGSKPTMHDLKYAGDVENLSEHILLGHAVAAERFAGGGKELVRYLSVAKNKDGSLSRSDVEIPWNETSASFMVVA